jgi:hypothetical protein
MKATPSTKPSKSYNKNTKNKCKENSIKPSSQEAWPSGTEPNLSSQYTNSKLSLSPDSKSPEPKENFKSIKTSSKNSDQESKPMKFLKAKKTSLLMKEFSKKLLKKKMLANKPSTAESNPLSKGMKW